MREMMRTMAKTLSERLTTTYLQLYESFSDLARGTCAIFGMLVLYSIEKRVFAGLPGYSPAEMSSVGVTALCLAYMFTVCIKICRLDSIGISPVMRDTVAAIAYIVAISHGFFVRLCATLVIVKYIVLLFDFLFCKIIAMRRLEDAEPCAEKSESDICGTIKKN